MSDCCPTCGQSLEHIEDVRFDHEVGVVVREGRFARFTPSQADLFAVLLESMPRIVAKEKAMAGLYSMEDEEPDAKIIDVYVCKMNKELKGLGIRIANEWGRGYRLVFDERETERSRNAA